MVPRSRMKGELAASPQEADLMAKHSKASW